MFAFEKALVYHCSPTLSGLKPANLLSLSKRDYPHLSELAEDTLSFFLPRGFSWNCLLVRPAVAAPCFPAPDAR